MLSTRHLPIKEGLVVGAEGGGDGWWRVGNSVTGHQSTVRLGWCRQMDCELVFCFS